MKLWFESDLSRVLRRTTLLGLGVVSSLTHDTARVAAFPLGRSWTTVEHHTIPGHTRLLPDAMLTSADGRPFVFANATGGIGFDGARLDWTGTSWTERWRLGTGPDYLRPMFGPDGTLGLVWSTDGDFEIPGPGGGTRQWVLTAEDFGTSIAAPETVGYMPDWRFSYGGTFSAKRRWVAFSNLPNLSLMYSDTTGIWRSIPVNADGLRGHRGVGMTTVDDTTALLAWGEENYPGGIRWGVVRGTTFEERPRLGEMLAGIPVWRAGPGGWHLFWVTVDPHIGHAVLEGTEVIRVDSLRAAYDLPGDYRTDGSLEAAMDGSEFPRVAWSASLAPSYAQVFAISLPTGSGFGIAEQAPMSYDALLPTSTADGNGDLWVAWGTFDIQGMYFIHTYVNVTTDLPQVFGSGTSRLVRWNLSGPAPKSWWAVLRSVGGGSLESIGRIQAGESTAMQFADNSPAASSLVRYQVRRECTDTRYEWLSPIRYWLHKKPRIELIAASSSQARDGFEFAVSEVAPGPIEIRVFDIQGRVVWMSRQDSADRPIAMRFNEAGERMRSGLYFAIVEDSQAQRSEPLKLVLVR